MVIKLIILLQLGFFWGFFISKYFHFLFSEKKVCKKICSQTFQKKTGFAALCFMHVFCQILYSIFIKWTKINVQNEKPRMNLEWPFFGDPKFGKIMQ